jgi:hypothetical protein
MNFEQIKLLLDKYFQGETSLEEEALLSTYFNSEESDSRLKNYQPLFQFFKAEKAVNLSKTATQKVLAVEKPVKRLNLLSRPVVMKLKASRRSSMWVKAIAAMLILTCGSYFLIKTLYKPKNLGLVENSRVIIYDENDDPQKAFEEVQAALSLVSKKMRKGQNKATSGLKKVKKATDDVHKIINQEE